MKIEFYRKIFEKYSSIKFNKNPSSGRRVVPCGQRETVRHDEANSRFSQFLRTHLKATDGNMNNSDLCAVCRHAKDVWCHKYGPDKSRVQYTGTQLSLS